MTLLFKIQKWTASPPTFVHEKKGLQFCFYYNRFVYRILLLFDIFCMAYAGFSNIRYTNLVVFQQKKNWKNTFDVLKIRIYFYEFYPKKLIKIVVLYYIYL